MSPIQVAASDSRDVFDPLAAGNAGYIATPAKLASSGIVDDAAVTSARILIVDDHEPNVALLSAFLRTADFTDIVSTTDSTAVVELCASAQPDLIMLDLHMPPPNGYDLLQMLAPWRQGSDRLPVIVLTADATVDAKHRALKLGANDFLTKPFDPAEVILRVRNLVETRLLQRELRSQNASLEKRVRERTRDLEEARVEVIERLARAAEYRDDATGDHPERVGRTAALLARELALDEETVARVRRAAPLHDVGKLGISDAILMKRGRLDDAELEVLKLHVTIGAELLGGSRSPLLRTSEEIALAHHERWDGTGYGRGLKGEEIPLAARLTAVADVFDALTHRRPYAEAWPIERAVEEVRKSSGRAFDPHVAEAFGALPHELLLSRPAEFDPFRSP